MYRFLRPTILLSPPQPAPEVVHITQFPALVHTICLCVTVLRPGRPLVRIQSGAPARRKRHIACDELFHFIAKLIVRSFCCSSLPNRNRFAGLQFGCRRCAAVLSVFVCHRKNIDFNRPLANHWHSGRLREHPIDRLVYCTGWSIFLFSFLVLLLNASTGAGRFFSYRHITGRISL